MGSFMTKEYQKFLTSFLDESKTKHLPKLSMVSCGLGISLAGIGLIPGSSEIFSDFTCLYDNPLGQRFIRTNTGACNAFKNKAVSKEAVFELARAMVCSLEHLAQERIVVAVTGAGTTNRPRRGKNEAFVCVSRDNLNSMFYIEFLNKLPDSHFEDTNLVWRNQVIQNQRTWEDEQVSKLALDLAVSVWENVVQVRSHDPRIKVSMI